MAAVARGRSRIVRIDEPCIVEARTRGPLRPPGPRPPGRSPAPGGRRGHRVLRALMAAAVRRTIGTDASPLGVGPALRRSRVRRPAPGAHPGAGARRLSTGGAADRTPAGRASPRHLPRIGWRCADPIESTWALFDTQLALDAAFDQAASWASVFGHMGPGTGCEGGAYLGPWTVEAREMGRLLCFGAEGLARIDLDGCDRAHPGHHPGPRRGSCARLGLLAASPLDTLAAGPGLLSHGVSRAGRRSTRGCHPAGSRAPGRSSPGW